MKNTLLGTAALLTLSVAAAAPKISAQSIIVNPVQPDLNVDVWVDRDQGGRGTPDYLIGDRIRIHTRVSNDAYVYLFNVNPDGTVDQILPNRYASGANFVKANTVKTFPSASDNFTFDIAGPYGVNKVLALASRTPLNLQQISEFRNNQPFASVSVRGQEGLAQALSIVVTPVPQNSWVTDVAQYNVARTYASQPVTVITEPAPPQPGGIHIDITIKPFASAQNVRTFDDDDGWRSEFYSNSRLDSVYAHYHESLSRQGYRLTEREWKGNKVEARYVNGRSVVKLEIKQKGGRYEVSLERDD